MQNFGVYIYTTHKNHNRCELIEKTWGKHIENLFFFTDKKIDKDNYIFCSTDDSYYSHMDKTFSCINYAHEKMSSKLDWHLIVGDDIFLYHYNLEKLLSQLDKNENSIFGELLKPGVGWKDLAYIGGGPGLLFNNNSLKNVVNNNNISEDDKKNYYLYSDVVVGIICKNNNINKSPQNGFFTHPPWNYGIKNPEDFIVFHYIKTTEQFSALYNRYKIK